MDDTSSLAETADGNPWKGLICKIWVNVLEGGRGVLLLYIAFTIYLNHEQVNLTIYIYYLISGKEKTKKKGFIYLYKRNQPQCSDSGSDCSPTKY